MNLVLLLVVVVFISCASQVCVLFELNLDQLLCLVVFKVQLFFNGVKVDKFSCLVRNFLNCLCANHALDIACRPVLANHSNISVLVLLANLNVPLLKPKHTRIVHINNRHCGFGVISFELLAFLSAQDHVEVLVRLPNVVVVNFNSDDLLINLATHLNSLKELLVIIRRLCRVINGLYPEAQVLINLLLYGDLDELTVFRDLVLA